MTPYNFSPLQRIWINDLKAGRFLQGSGRLGRRTKNKKVKYCCLGVACAIINREAKNLGLKRLPVSHNENKTCVKFDTAWVVLNDEITATLNLRSSGGKLKSQVEIKGRKYSALYEMNDNGYMTHKEIGAYIEANPENVFKS